MAALNTLRTKGAIVMTSAIAFALLAFLLSDGNFMNQQPKIVVGTINGEEVPMKDFSERVDDMVFYNQFVSNRSALATEETEQLNQQVWQQLVLESMINESIVNLGLSVASDELVDMAGGQFSSPILTSLFRNELGQLNKESLVGFVSQIDMDPSGKASKFWKLTEKQIGVEREMSKLITLIHKGMFVTDLEVENGVANSSTAYDLNYVMAPKSEEKIEVSESEMKAYYDKNNERFRKEAYRAIEYIVYEATPSQEDYAQAQKNFAELATEFKATEDLAQFVDLNSEEKFDARYYSEKMLSPEVAEFAFGKNSTGVYEPALEGNIYTAIRVISSKLMPDSITIRAIGIPTAMNIDSAINVVKSNKNGFDSIAESFSLGAPETRAEQTFSTSDIVEPKLLQAKKGEVITMDGGQGTTTLVYVTNTDKQVRKVQLAKLVYNVVPSNRTEQINFALATEFGNKAAAKGSSFDQTVTELGLEKRVANLLPTDRKVNELPETKEIVRWAFNAKVGDISTVITSGSSNYVAVLTTAFEGGIVPFAELKEDIKRELEIEKRIENSKKQLATYASLEDAAKALNTEVMKAEGVTFNSFYVQGIGIAPSMIGLMTTTPVNTLSKPVAAGADAVIFNVADKKVNEVSAESQKTMIESLNASNLESRVLGSFITSSKIVDNRIIYM